MTDNPAGMAPECGWPPRTPSELNDPTSDLNLLVGAIVTAQCATPAAPLGAPLCDPTDPIIALSVASAAFHTEVRNEAHPRSPSRPWLSRRLQLDDEQTPPTRKSPTRFRVRRARQAERFSLQYGAAYGARDRGGSIPRRGARPWTGSASSREWARHVLPAQLGEPGERLHLAPALCEKPLQRPLAILCERARRGPEPPRLQRDQARSLD